MKGGDSISTNNNERDAIIQDFIAYSIFLAGELDRKDVLTEIEQKWFESVDKFIGILDKETINKIAKIWRD